MKRGDDKPLLAASNRLKGRPGRPRRRHVLGTPGDGAGPQSGSEGRAQVREAIARLLPLDAAAHYLGLSVWSVRELEYDGILRRVRVPLGNGRELRKLLFDREDLDRLIEGWKD